MAETEPPLLLEREHFLLVDGVLVEDIEEAKKENEEERQRLEPLLFLMKAFVQQVGLTEELAPRLLASDDDLRVFASGRPGAALDNLPFKSGWRAEVILPGLTAIAQGRPMQWDGAKVALK
jgi:hypothetical protein